VKVGILTYHNARNYGAVLQSYALCETIKTFGVECEIIDYRCEKLENVYNYKKIPLSNAREFVKWLITYGQNRKMDKNFQEFKKIYLTISKDKYNYDLISRTNDKYDLIICGSDQIWNLYLNGEDYTYFLNFVNNTNKKMSYAASFGFSKVPDEFKENIKNMLNDFNYLSVRENSAKNIISDLTGKNAEIVLDPTLLIDKKRWDMIAKTPLYKKPYIFVYTIAPAPGIFEFSKKLAKEKNCDIIYLRTSHRIKKGMHNICGISPNEFIGYVKNASCVVTTSYHGFCFSLIYEKDFFYALDTSSNNNNSRLETLADLLNLRSKCINYKDNLSFDDIDYKEINKILEKEKEKSLKYLKNLID